MPGPWTAEEDEIDERVRHDLDRWERDGEMAFVGRDGPRLFPATGAEAGRALRHFVDHRLPAFGPHQDAMLAADPFMAHSMLSPAMNLGLLDPHDVRARGRGRLPRRARAARRASRGTCASSSAGVTTSGTCTGTSAPDTASSTACRPIRSLPGWFEELDADAVEARCLSWALAQVRDTGFAHHIVRLMVLGNYALQRGYRPGAADRLVPPLLRRRVRLGDARPT